MTRASNGAGQGFQAISSLTSLWLPYGKTHVQTYIASQTDTFPPSEY